VLAWLLVGWLLVGCGLVVGCWLVAGFQELVNFKVARVQKQFKVARVQKPIYIFVKGESFCKMQKLTRAPTQTTSPKQHAHRGRHRVQ
jgi:hypothetical protein